MAVTVVSGVAGSGKTTVGAALAARLGVEFADADDFHPPVNVTKMTSGIPLTDADRAPWLDALRAWMSTHPTGVLACSALSRSHRDRLRPANFVYLKISRSAARERLGARKDHFFGPELIDSQFATLEESSGSEDVLVLDALSSVDGLVEHIRNHLRRLGPADA
jgi:carbohydrate kinase (thermoresistant glucokinase family)